VGQTRLFFTASQHHQHAKPNVNYYLGERGMKYLNTEKEQGKRIIITVIGPDRVGIIAGVTGILAANDINILDISQTIMQEFLVMVLIADMEKSKIDLTSLKDNLSAKGEELGVRIDAQHEDAFKFMHRL
jgi:ACT domain-containing protein